MYEKIGKSWNCGILWFPIILDSGGSKSRLAKAAGAEPTGQIRKRKIICRCSAMYICKFKIPGFRTTFGN